MVNLSLGPGVNPLNYKDTVINFPTIGFGGCGCNEGSKGRPFFNNKRIIDIKTVMVCVRTRQAERKID